MSGHLGFTSLKTSAGNLQSFSSCFYLFLNCKKKFPRGREGYCFLMKEESYDRFKEVNQLSKHCEKERLESVL